MNKIIKTGLFSLIVGVTTISCSDDFVERQFFQEVEQAPLTSTQEMQSFVRGIYASMRNTTYYGADFMAYAEVRSDEMYSTLQGGYYTNVYNYSQLSNDTYAVGTYNRIYEVIGKANIVINTDLNSLSGTSADKATATFAQGQAYALRAMAFFDAFRLYGQKYIPNGTLGIVMPLKYDPKALVARSTIAETEAQIDKDFTKALELMTNGTSYFSASTKTELSIYALKGLMSRFYLYKGDYAKVRSLTNDIVAFASSTSSTFNVVASGLFQTSFQFVMNGAAPNSIFELAVGTNASLSTGSYRQRLSLNGYANIVVSQTAYDSYANNDIRKGLITISNGIRYLSVNNRPGKYTNATGADNIKMLRYEEILLNGVEAELQPGGNPAKALTYYNQIVTNRGLAAATTVTMTMLKAERMKELLGEGLRQWDLRRWGDAVPRPTSASTDPNMNAFPIPRGETDIPGTPVVSNPGYDN